MIEPLTNPEFPQPFPKLFLQINRSLITDKSIASTESSTCMNRWHIKSPGFSNLIQMNVPSHVNTIAIMDSANRTRKEILMIPIVSFHYDQNTIVDILRGKDTTPHFISIYIKGMHDKLNSIAVVTPPNVPDDMEDALATHVFLKTAYTICQEKHNWFHYYYNGFNPDVTEILARVVDL